MNLPTSAHRLNLIFLALSSYILECLIIIFNLKLHFQLAFVKAKLSYIKFKMLRIFWSSLKGKGERLKKNGKKRRAFFKV